MWWYLIVTGSAVEFCSVWAVLILLVLLWRDIVGLVLLVIG